MNEDLRFRGMIKRKWLIGAGVLNLFVFGCLLPVGWYKTHDARDFATREEVVAQVQKGILKADVSGNILLPKEHAGITADGHVYQAYDKQSGVVLLFPTEVHEYLVGRGDGTSYKQRDVAGYVYCPGRLPGDEWFSFPGMNGVSTWHLNKPVRPHWYYVEPFYSD